MRTKGPLSRGVKWFREGVKELGGKTAATLLGRQSYPLMGLPCGLTPGEGRVEIFYPSTRSVLPLPKSVDQALHWRFQAEQEEVVEEEAGIFTVPHATSTHLGGHLSTEGKLITRYLRTPDGKPAEKHDLLRLSTRRFFPRLLKSEGPLVTLTHAWQGAFFHWMYEVLPLLHLIEKGGLAKEKLFVAAETPFQKQTLELLGVTSDQIVNILDYEAVTTPLLHIPFGPAIPTTWGCHYLRKKIVPQLPSKAPCRLYISRAKSRWRRLLNEEEVMTLLSRYGFTKVILEDLPLREQMALFQAAEVVVGPHGAGFSHLAFCAPKTPLLEFFSPAYVNCCYWHLAGRADLDYHVLMGEGSASSNSIDPDFTLSLSKLEASLHLMGL